MVAIEGRRCHSPPMSATPLNLGRKTPALRAQMPGGLPQVAGGVQPAGIRRNFTGKVKPERILDLDRHGPTTAPRLSPSNPEDRKASKGHLKRVFRKSDLLD